MEVDVRALRVRFVIATIDTFVSSNTKVQVTHALQRCSNHQHRTPLRKPELSFLQPSFAAIHAAEWDRRPSGKRGTKAGRVHMNSRRTSHRAGPRNDSDLFGEGVRKPEADKRIQAAIKRGFQTREAEMSLGRLLGEWADR